MEYTEGRSKRTTLPRTRIVGGLWPVIISYIVVNRRSITNTLYGIITGSFPPTIRERYIPVHRIQRECPHAARSYCIIQETTELTGGVGGPRPCSFQLKQPGIWIHIE